MCDNTELNNNKMNNINERKSNFPKLSTKKIFQKLDKDKNGKIDLNEWLGYWKHVYKAGYSQEDIVDELEGIEMGKGWVSFRNVK